MIHPQSIVHCLAYYRDGSVLAHMSPPDMRTPIAYSLAWPDRMDVPMAPLDLPRLGPLTFQAADETRFPALRLARQALSSGAGAGTVLNAANEVAGQAFLNGAIGFLAIAALVEEAMEASPDLVGAAPATPEDVIAVDRETRIRASAMVPKFASERRFG